MPLISVVMTVFKEAEAARVSVESLLAQSFEDYELVIVDDGADDETRAVIHAYEDARIRVIRQANDGLSSARNRGLSQCTGSYVCFLDADDMRPSWSLETLAHIAIRDRPDCVFTQGRLVDFDKNPRSFYDSEVFEEIKRRTHAQECFDASEVAFTEVRDLLPRLEPQSANKLVSRSLLQRHFIQFPNGLFFEDFFFHISLICTLQRFSLAYVPCFTYFRRYGHRQITGSTSSNRFDAISVVTLSMEALKRSNAMKRRGMRLNWLVSVARVLSWSEQCVAYAYRSQFQEMLLRWFRSVPELFREDLKALQCGNVTLDVPVESGTLDFLETLAESADSEILPAPVVKSGNRPEPRVDSVFFVRQRRFFGSSAVSGFIDPVDSYGKLSARLLRRISAAGIDQVLVYGAGNIGSVFLQTLFDSPYKIECLGVVDSNTNLQGTQLHGHDVVSLDSAMATGCDHVVVASIAHVVSIRNTLISAAEIAGRQLVIHELERE